MKLFRILFVIVLLASVALVPTKQVSAAATQPAPILVVTTDFQDVVTGNWVTLAMFIKPAATQTVLVPVKLTVTVDHPEYLDLTTLTPLTGKLTDWSVAADGKSITWTGALVVGSLGEVQKVKVKAGKLPTGVGQYPIKATVTVVSYGPVPGTIPDTTASTVFDVVNPAQPAFVINAGVDKLFYATGDVIKAAVSFASTPGTMRDLVVDVTIVLKPASYVGAITLDPTCPIGTKKDDTTKTVSYHGKLNNADGSAITIKFSAPVIATASVSDMAAGIVTDTDATNFMVNGAQDTMTSTIAVATTGGYINYLPSVQNK